MIENKNVELTPENVSGAIEYAAIVYAPARERGIFAPIREKWFFDLDLFVGKKMVGCPIGLSIDSYDRGDYFVTLHPYDHIDYFIIDLPEFLEVKSDAKAKEILCAHAKRFLGIVAKKGLYRKRDPDGDFQWYVGKITKVKYPIYFRPTKPRGIMNNGTVLEGWRIIQNPFGSK